MQKGVYPHEHMDDWEKNKETSLPEKDFYSHLNIEDLINAHYTHATRVCKDFEITNLGEYHDLHDQNESSYLQYWDVNNLYGWAMLKKLPVKNFEWIKDSY